MDQRDRLMTANNAWTWLLRRKIEIAIFLLGILLRLSMIWNYHFAWNYDSDAHWEVVQWIVKHGTLPTVESTFESFHPPLYYAIAAWLVRHGATRPSLVGLSITCGVIRLATIWAGLELYLVRSRCARIMALALAAVVSASVHLDGMIYTEAMSCMLLALVMLLVPLAFRRVGRFRWPLTLGIGLILGMAMMTKVSAVAVLGAVGVAIVAELALNRRSVWARAGDLAPWLGMMAVLLGICGWYYARNLRQYGTPFVTSFSLPSQHWLVADTDRQLFSDRRTLGFLFSWSDSIYKSPYRPAALSGRPRFFPVAIASSVVDYWGFGFSGYEHPTRPGGGKPVAEVRNVSRLAAIGGTAIFFAAVVAWFACVVWVLRYRDFGRLALLLVPLFMLLATLHFVISCPVDDYGVIKGVYMTFGAPSIYALFGVAAGWAQRRPIRWPLLGACGIALWFVAAYTVECRLGIKIWPVT
jgi:hypothetical protein